jgi:hypothetical protein
MLGQHSLAIAIDLDLPFASHTCTLKTKIKTADSSE